MTVSPFDHPYLSGLLGDEEVASFFSAAAELEAMLAFEVALAKAEALAGIIPVEAAHAIEIAAHRFSPDVASLRAATARDGVVVPDLVRQLRTAVGEPHARHVHFGATSQDVIDSGMMLRLSRVLPLLEERLDHALILGEKRGEKVGVVDDRVSPLASEGSGVAEGLLGLDSESFGTDHGYLAIS